MSDRRCSGVAAILLLAVLNACGGGGAGSSTQPPPPPLPTGANVAPLIVDAGPKQLGVNLPSVTVTICSPGTSTCQTIDHILVDTGSTGLRIMYEALKLTPASLPAVKTAAGDPIYECFPFADGDSWGSVRTADVQLANGKATGLKIQLIGDPAVPASSAGCNATQNTVAGFGANGILGVSVFLTDCGSGCASAAVPGGGIYYVCTASPCVGTTALPPDQILNPVSKFAANNNGVVIVLPPITAAGQATVSGALVLGIDTQSNNQLGSSALLSVDPLSGNFTAIFNGQTYRNGGSIDSGSNGNFFTDTKLQACTSALYTGWYCPAMAATLSVTNQGAGASSATSSVTFSVASIEALTNANGNFAAYDNIAGTLPKLIMGFDWGLPFFFGRSVSVAFEGQATAAGAGPFFAYADF